MQVSESVLLLLSILASAIMLRGVTDSGESQRCVAPRPRLQSTTVFTTGDLGDTSGSVTIVFSNKIRSESEAFAFAVMLLKRPLNDNSLISVIAMSSLMLITEL